MQGVSVVCLQGITVRGNLLLLYISQAEKRGRVLINEGMEGEQKIDHIT